MSNYKCVCGVGFEEKSRLAKHKAKCEHYREFIAKIAKDPETLALIIKLGSLSAAARELGVSHSSLDNAMRKHGTHPYGRLYYGKRAKAVGDLLSTITVIDSAGVKAPQLLDVTSDQVLDAVGYMIGELKLLREKVAELELENVELAEELSNIQKKLHKTYSLHIENECAQQGLESKGLAKV